MGFVTQLVVWLNLLANSLAGWLLVPLGFLPGWLSATLVAAATGVLMLVVFKYTSNQHAIKRVKDDIKANLLALKLFKDSALVALRAQGRILQDAGSLLVYAIVPMAVMALPAVLILAQLSLWYQARPLRVGEDVVLTVKFQGSPDSPWPDVHLEPDAAIEVLVGPIRVQSQREICWNLQGRAAGYHRLKVHVGDQLVEKELAVGDGFMRVSTLRPSWRWSDALLYPEEEPFALDSPVQSIELEYPERPSWVSGTNTWVIYWLIVSMVAAFCFRRFLNVQF
jgi:hypothetical protein